MEEKVVSERGAIFKKLPDNTNFKIQQCFYLVECNFLLSGFYKF